MHPLIPVPSNRLRNGFTSSSSLAKSSGNSNIKHVPLDDSALGVHKIFNRTSYNVVSPPVPSHPNPDDGEHPEEAWEAFYPRGSINPSASIVGGFGFYVAGPPGFLNGTVNEAIMSYRVIFESGWEWAKGGKLPGIFGGEGDASYRCSGGRQNDRCQCFDARLMWRPNGAGEIYTYFPLTEGNEAAILRVPGSRKNPDYGFSVGRGAFTWPVGRWVGVALRVKLNEINNQDGELELYIDGKTVISVHGLTMKMSKETKVKGMHFQTFFGGHTEDWASPKDQKAWFGDVTVVVLGSEKLALSPAGSFILPRIVEDYISIAISAKDMAKRNHLPGLSTRWHDKASVSIPTVVELNFRFSYDGQGKGGRPFTPASVPLRRRVIAETTGYIRLVYKGKKEIGVSCDIRDSAYDIGHTLILRDLDTDG